MLPRYFHCHRFAPEQPHARRLRAHLAGTGKSALAALVTAVLWTPVGAGAAPSTSSAGGLPGSAAPLPESSPGTCVAKVAVPAIWESEEVEVERRSAHTTFAITPARFGERKRRVVVRDASTTLEPVQPLMKTELQVRPYAEASSRWVRDGLEGLHPMSSGDRLDLVAAGVDIDAAPVGTCYVEHFRAAAPVTKPERVLVREASEQLSVTEAVFETVDKKVVTRPAHSRLIEVPAVWEESERQVIRQAASVAWEPGHGPIQYIDHMTGEIMWRVDVPAVVETVTQSSVATAALVTRIGVPEESKTVKVQRLVTDAQGAREPVPAVWDTLEVPQDTGPGEYVWHAVPSTADEDEPVIAAALPTDTPDSADVPTGRTLCHRPVPEKSLEYERLVLEEDGRFELEENPVEVRVEIVSALLADASSTRVEIPAELDFLEKRVQTREAGVEWRPVLCETNVTRNVIVGLQTALEREGFSPGAIDGRLGPGTLSAVDRYQKSESLATGGLTIETIEALGVEL